MKKESSVARAFKEVPLFAARYENFLKRLENQGASAAMLKELLLEKASNLGIAIQTKEVMPNHVHLFIVANPNMNIGTIVKYLKGYSSYHLRRIFIYLQKYPSLWTRSYFAESVGHITEKTIVNYITSQKSKTLSSPG